MTSIIIDIDPDAPSDAIADAIEDAVENAETISDGDVSLHQTEDTDTSRVIAVDADQNAAVGTHAPEAVLENGCPDCGTMNLAGVEPRLDSQTVEIDQDEARIQAFVHRRNVDVLGFTRLTCDDCGAVIIEDADVVHDAV